jgi:surfactin synthase thioesterase subunit
VTSATPIQLFCFPHAGSSVAPYARWKRRVPEWLQIVPVELPGRGRRTREPLESTFAGLLQRVLDEVRPEPALPFALFGHSLGALLAYEVGCRVADRLGRAPLIVFASGTHAPSRRDPQRFANLETDAELRAELEKLCGTPRGVLDSRELMELTLPILRADFRAAGDYRAQPGLALTVPLHVFGGSSDTTTSETLMAWREHTRAEFSLDVLPGGHFFLFEHEATVLARIEQRLTSASASSARRAHGTHFDVATARPEPATSDR